MTREWFGSLQTKPVLVSQAADSFQRRLDPAESAPIAVAYSGGGDSLMALKLAKAWADAHGRAVVALHVDHGLRAASGAWGDAARAVCERLGLSFRLLCWTGDKPSTGLPAAARAARHGLIAEAARGLGARVVVFGHTADDVIEGDLMRADGLRLGRLREWSPSPVWPEGRGIFLLRPLLAARRTDIRAALAAEGETWIDDPANQDPKSPRARVRPRAAEAPAPPPLPAEDAGLAELARTAAIGDDGAIRLSRERLRRAPRERLHPLLAAALACASGQTGTPRAARLKALAERLASPEPFVATLGGAKVLATETVLIVRDAGEIRRGSLKPLALYGARAGVWDGRFEVTAAATATRAMVHPMSGRMGRLSPVERAGLRAVDAAVRPSLPVVDLGEVTMSCPILAREGSVDARSLVKKRFLAACGVFLREAAT